MNLGLSSEEIAGMLAGAGDRMEQHYETIAQRAEPASELSRLFSSMMVTLSATVQDIVVANNQQVVRDLRQLGVLK